MSTQVDIHLQGVEDVLSYQFNDRNILWEALQAASSRVVSIGGRVLTDGNKRLAMLGDAIVNVALIEEWYASGQSKGEATQIIQTVCTNTNLDRVARLHGLNVFVNKNPSQGRIVSTNVMTATLEAILGAIYLDGDLDAVKRVMRRLVLVPT